jgi:hypothetical protein
MAQRYEVSSSGVTIIVPPLTWSYRIPRIAHGSYNITLHHLAVVRDNIHIRAPFQPHDTDGHRRANPTAPTRPSRWPWTKQQCEPTTPSSYDAAPATTWLVDSRITGHARHAPWLEYAKHTLLARSDTNECPIHQSWRILPRMEGSRV